METIVGNYTVEVFEEHGSYCAVDHPWKYELTYLDNMRGSYSTLIGIKIFEENSLITSAIIGADGGGTGIHETSCIYEPERLLVCCSDTIFCLSIPSLTLSWKTKADFAACFEIFKCQGDYLVHGEMEISRLANDGQIVWQRIGADIFTTLNSSKEDFKVTRDYILATDWDDRKYKFDFDGNHIA